MFSAITANESTILKLWVKGSDLDPLALRGRLQQVLGEVSFQPRLPPSATLFIRKLKDPLPGLLQLDTTHPRAPEAWRHAFNTKFEQLVSSAARPAFGLVSDSAESVVFYDYAELLASLAADWCSGYATTRWWWRSLIQRGDVAQLIKRLWREHVEYVPAALEVLVKRNVLVEFVSRLSDDEVRVLIERVIHVFALQAMRHIKTEPQITRMEDTDFLSEICEIQEVSVREVMPWGQVVPESDTPRLRPVQQLFVGVALMVRRAPSRVRTVSFAKEVERWCEQVIALPTERQPMIAKIERAEFDEVTVETSAAVVASEVVVAPSIEEPAPLGPVQEKAKREQVKIGNAVFSYEEPSVVSETRVEPQPVIASERKPEIEPAPQESTQVSEPLEAITIETELGGLFYLINLAIFLEIYNDFTSPDERITTDLSIWDFVAIVGADLNGDEDVDDPIWSLLKHLANPENPISPVKPDWLTELIPQLYTRLGELAKILLHHHAKVVITATHLDVFFSLADHPIEIRIAGLDRNPGWVPAAGRFIAFHYD